MNLENKKKIVNDWFCYLHAQICKEFEAIDLQNLKYQKNLLIKPGLKRKLVKAVVYQVC